LKAAERQRRHERHVEEHLRPSVPLEGRTLVVSPKILKLSSNDTARRTIRFFRKMYRIAVQERGVALVDLSALVDASTPALTVMAAEIARCLEIAPGSVQGIAPTSASMSHLLDRYGVSAALGLPVASDGSAVGVLRIRNGLAEEIRRTEFLDRFLDPVFPEDTPLKGRVKGAVTEALLNIVDHAYPADIARTDVCPSGRWWISGYRSDLHKRLWLCVYDLGVGLPATLPRSRSSAIRNAISTMTGSDFISDHKMIKLAVHTSLTQTGAQGRGRGLREMARLIDRAGEGALWIMSRDGTYIYGRGTHDQDVGSMTAETLRGTLIVWTIKITDAAASDGEVPTNG